MKRGILTALLLALLPCSAALAQMAPWQAHGKLRVSANGHVIEHADGGPFLWMGGTAWGLFPQLTREEVDHYPVRPVAAAQPAREPHHRLVVLSDIEADPDDTQSFVRLLLYANAIDIEGMIATTSVHQKTRVAPESIRRVIEAYGKVRDNLLLHEPGFPETQVLLDRVTQGLPEYGLKGVGDGKDSPGSNRIIELLDRADDRPLWVSVWGGPNTLAQALYSLRKSRRPAEVERLVSKLRVYTISDQDDTGTWLRTEFPKLFYVVSPGGYRHSTWGAINAVVEGIDNTTISNAWLAGNIQQGHGPLGVATPMWRTAWKATRRHGWPSSRTGCRCPIGRTGAGGAVATSTISPGTRTWISAASLAASRSRLSLGRSGRMPLTRSLVDFPASTGSRRASTAARSPATG